MDAPVVTSSCPECRSVEKVYIAKRSRNGHYHVGEFCSGCGHWVRWVPRHESRRPVVLEEREPEGSGGQLVLPMEFGEEVR